MYFLTVKRCNDSKREIFCYKNGDPFAKCKPHTSEEMNEFLGIFSLILSPESAEMTEEEVKEHNFFRPLAEYQSQYGIALTSLDVPLRYQEATE